MPKSVRRPKQTRDDPAIGFALVVDEITSASVKATVASAQLEAAFVARHYAGMQAAAEQIKQVASQNRAMAEVIARQIAKLRQREPEKGHPR